MPKRHKPLSEQVIVMTGATSPVGMVTARMAARQGARLVLGAGDAAALDRLAGDIRRAGGEVLAVRVDASIKEQVTALGRAAMRRFGCIDTWINHGAADNDAAPTQAARERRFKSDYWATVHGTIAAHGLMKQDGGAIVNLDSTASAKHDVKGFTDALRAEIDTDGVPITVTLVHGGDAGAKTAPQLMAEAILTAARYAKADVYAGRATRAWRNATAAPGPLSRITGYFVPRHAHKTWHF